MYSSRSIPIITKLYLPALDSSDAIFQKLRKTRFLKASIFLKNMTWQTNSESSIVFSVPKSTENHSSLAGNLQHVDQYNWLIPPVPSNSDNNCHHILKLLCELMMSHYKILLGTQFSPKIKNSKNGRFLGLLF